MCVYTHTYRWEDRHYMLSSATFYLNPLRYDFPTEFKVDWTDLPGSTFLCTSSVLWLYAIIAILRFYVCAEDSNLGPHACTSAFTQLVVSKYPYLHDFQIFFSLVKLSDFISVYLACVYVYRHKLCMCRCLCECAHVCMDLEVSSGSLCLPLRLSSCYFTKQDRQQIETLWVGRLTGQITRYLCFYFIWHWGCRYAPSAHFLYWCWEKNKEANKNRFSCFSRKYVTD